MSKPGRRGQRTNKLRDEVTKGVCIIAPIDCYSGYSHLQLTLSQTTNFRLFQTERVCRRQF